jgi:nucleoside-diphosphate-sugar epimerase
VRRAADRGAGILGFDDPDLPDLVRSAPFLLSSVPPDAKAGEDPVLARFGGALAARRGGWTGYLSSTGVYGDTGGAWVDETAPIGTGRRSARTAADLGWQALGATILRLPGIYGPGRSAFDQLAAGIARRIDRPGHRFNRIHVDDIAGATLALMAARATGIFNIVDALPAEPRHVTEFACMLAGRPVPPLESLDIASLSPMARGFWSERRCVTGARLPRVTGYRLLYPDYKSGLTAIHAEGRRAP